MRNCIIKGCKNKVYDDGIHDLQCWCDDCAKDNFGVVTLKNGWVGHKRPIYDSNDYLIQVDDVIIFEGESIFVNKEQTIIYLLDAFSMDDGECDFDLLESTRENYSSTWCIARQFNFDKFNQCIKHEEMEDIND